MKYGVDPVEQFKTIFQEMYSLQSLRQDRKLRISGFACPLYSIDESKLGMGFSQAVTGIKKGNIEEFPRYKRKFDRLIGLANKMAEVFGGRAQIYLDVIMGDKGVINADELGKKCDLSALIQDNIAAYQNYLCLLKVEQTVNIQFLRVTEIVGGEITDLCEDGKKLEEKSQGLFRNEKVFAKVDNERLNNLKNGKSGNEPLGFALNYGLAGFALVSMGVDALIGTDMPGSYLNYLYHAFIKPEDLLVMVPKHNEEY